MVPKSLLRSFQAILSLGLFLFFPLENKAAVAQQNLDFELPEAKGIQYNKLSLQKLLPQVASDDFTKAEDLELTPLTIIEENIARNLNSHWVWAEYTLEMIDSYSPFLFRTKKSQELEEVIVLLEVDSRGKLAGFEVVGEIDKGLKERLDYVIRKLPECKPVPGFESYTRETFELTIRR
jgi:hypothetical protein